MEAKDILRIVLFFFLAIFALRSVSFNKVRNASQQNNNGENEEGESQQLFQQSLDTRNRVDQEPIGGENKSNGKEIRSEQHI